MHRPKGHAERHPGRRLVARPFAAIVALGVLLAGCGAATRVVPIRLDPEATPPRVAASLRTYASAIPATASVLVTDLRLPLSDKSRVFVYQSERAYAEGLAELGRMSVGRAAEIASYSVGLGQHRRLFINDGAFHRTPHRVWLAILAHELTHLSQYELSGGRRGRSEQWLREGMADWVACHVLERLDAPACAFERDRARRAVAQALPELSRGPLDLVDLGRPRGWEARHLRSGNRLTYRLAFLLTDELVREHGFERLVAYFRAFAESDDRFGQFERVFGRSLAEFEREALERIRTEIGPRSPAGSGAPPIPLGSQPR